MNFIISGNSFDESSQMKPLRSTSTAGGGGSLAPSGRGGESRNQEFDTSFDASNGGEAFDDDEDVVYTLQGKKLFSNFSCRFLIPNNFFQFELQLF